MTQESISNGMNDFVVWLQYFVGLQTQLETEEEQSQIRSLVNHVLITQTTPGQWCDLNSNTHFYSRLDYTFDRHDVGK